MQQGKFYLDGNNGIGVAPCKDCERRRVGCHAECAAYQAYRQELDTAKAVVGQNRSNDEQMAGYCKEKMTKIERKRRQKR